MTYLFIFLLITVALLLFFFAFAGFSFARQNKKRKTKKIAKQNTLYADGVMPGCCPLCATPLTNGEKINSVVFDGSHGTDRLCRILGCPHCKPSQESSIDKKNGKGAVQNALPRRVCPVCKKAVPQDGYLSARLFERKNNAHHVHILGCTECRFGK